ncbi:zinc-binding dehydrogenase [Hoeflea sp. WL0058]|uniref:Zinc-binding dehydrogenase n=1 Tax=Flavimaribacter sediminis TaxID=2865987 RepID=A0AAE2ZRW1_9HYPH|nr:zinc-binding dehydrogenase [Flavimaribacter sediminis]MBW8639826.1 zinc-binding dehydrogenase [Flavimaribacter sediminis]
MRAIVFNEHGPFENLQEAEIPQPEAGPGQLLLRVKAVSLNGFDPMVMRGIPGLRTPLPMIPGADISAEVVEFGPDVDQSKFSLGQRVAINPSNDRGMMGETLRGGMCEFIAVDQSQILPIPDDVTDVQAACLPTAYATAYRMLFSRGGVKSGESILILGASGGVGTCCIQLAKAAGCHVIAVTSSKDKAEKLKAIGADDVVDASETSYVDFVIDKFGKPRTKGPTGGVDVCVNYSGGDSWAECFKVVKRDGRILTCGATAGYDPKTDIRYIWSFEQTIIGSNGWRQSDHERMLDMIAKGELDPVIDRVVPMSDVQSAMRDLHDRKVTGKVVLTVPQ